MAGRIELVGPGADAEEALFASIRRAQGGDRLATISVVVRGPVVALDLRRRLAERGAFAGTRFTPLSRFIELLAAGAEGGAERRPLTNPVLGASIRVALRSAPGVLCGVAGHPATEESLVRTYRVLRPLSPADRRHVASMSARAADVVRIVEAARESVQSGWYDLDDLAESAVGRIERGEVDIDDVGPVVLHLPDPVGPAQAALLEALAGPGDVTILAGVVGDEAGDRASNALVDQLRRRGFDVVPDSRGKRRHDGSAEGVTTAQPLLAKPCFDRVLGLPDLEEEVRMAVRLLVAHAGDGGQLGRTAVAFPGSRAHNPYLQVIAEMFSAAGIPWTGPATATLADVGPGRVVIDLLRLLVSGSFERTGVIGWISSPALTSRCGLFAGLRCLKGEEGASLPVGAFDRCSRAAGVVSGTDEWRSRLGAFARRLALRESVAAEAEAARDLVMIIDRLARLGQLLRRAATWAEVAAWGVEVVEAVVEPGDEQDRLGDAVAELIELGTLEELALPAPVGTRPTVASLPRAGDRSAVDDPAADDMSEDRWAGQLLSAFASALSSPAGRHGRFGVGPVVGPIATLAGIRTDLLVVLGAGEGVLPARTTDDPLVTEVEREAVRALADRERVEDRDRRTTLTLLAGAATSVATYPRVARGASRPAYPSRWLSGDLFTGEPEETASFSAAVASVAGGDLAPADTTDLELALIHRGLVSDQRLGDLVVAALPDSDLGDLGARLGAERERGGHGLTRFGGRVGPVQPSDDIFTEVMSATRMESLARCPLQFMFERLVRVEVLQAPDRRHMIEPRERGSLIHSVLEEFVESTVISRGSVPFDGWDDEQSIAALHQIADRYFEEYEERGLTGKAVYWRMAKARTRSDLERFVAIESRRLRESGAIPVRTEMGFGFSDGVPPVVIDAGGRNLQFRGKIDRIDAEPGDLVRVIDYKSGKAGDFTGIEKDPLDGGRHLQLPIYARAARALVAEEAASVIAEFRFCSSEGGFKTVPVALTPELDSELERVLGILGDTIERGSFPPRPGSGDERQPANCRRCDYESICRLDRATLWQRANDDGSMTEYVDLVTSQKTLP